MLQIPLDGEHYAMHRSKSVQASGRRAETIVFSVAVSNDVNRLDWFLDGKKIATTKPGKTYTWHPQVGAHELVIVDDLGRMAQARFTVHEHLP